jgi:hypothetical protein
MRLKTLNFVPTRLLIAAACKFESGRIPEQGYFAHMALPAERLGRMPQVCG